MGIIVTKTSYMDINECPYKPLLQLYHESKGTLIVIID